FVQQVGQDGKGGQIQNAKQQTVTQFNNALNQFLLQQGQRLAGPSQALNLQINQLNQALGYLGGSPIKPSPMQPETPELDDDGLMKAPNSMLAAMQKGLQPPLPDLSQGGFEDAAGSLAQSQQNQEQKLTRIEQEYIQVKSVERMCDASQMSAPWDRLG